MMPRQRQGLIAREIGGESLLLDRHGGFVHQLNVTAAYIWDRCDGGSSVEAVAAELSERFGIDAATARHDVMKTIDALAGLGLLDATPRGNQCDAAGRQSAAA
jgi:hypothetical protein